MKGQFSDKRNMNSATVMATFVKWKLIPIKITQNKIVEKDFLGVKTMVIFAFCMAVVGAYFYQMFLHKPNMQWTFVTIVDLVFRMMVYMGNEIIPTAVADGAKRIGMSSYATKSSIHSGF